MTMNTKSTEPSVINAVWVTGGNAVKTAELCGVSHRTMQRWRLSNPYLEAAFTEAREEIPSESIEEMLASVEHGMNVQLSRLDTGKWQCSIEAEVVEHVNLKVALAWCIIKAHYPSTST